MPDEKFSRRLENMESKLAEMEDLQLSNKIEVLEMKSKVEELLGGEGVPESEGGAPKAAKPLSKDAMKAIEDLHKTQNKIQRRLDKLSREVGELKEGTAPKKGTGGEPGASLEVGEINTKLKKVKEMMGEK